MRLFVFVPLLFWCFGAPKDAHGDPGGPNQHSPIPALQPTTFLGASTDALSDASNSADSLLSLMEDSLVAQNTETETIARPAKAAKPANPLKAQEAADQMLFLLDDSAPARVKRKREIGGILSDQTRTGVHNGVHNATATKTTKATNQIQGAAAQIEHAALRIAPLERSAMTPKPRPSEDGVPTRTGDPNSSSNEVAVMESETAESSQLLQAAHQSQEQPNSDNAGGTLIGILIGIGIASIVLAGAAIGFVRRRNARLESLVTKDMHVESSSRGRPPASTLSERRPSLSRLDVARPPATPAARGPPGTPGRGMPGTPGTPGRSVLLARRETRRASVENLQRALMQGVFDKFSTGGLMSYQQAVQFWEKKLEVGLDDDDEPEVTQEMWEDLAEEMAFNPMRGMAFAHFKQLVEDDTSIYRIASACGVENIVQAAQASQSL